MPENCLARKALTENVNLRTNWIRTIEKLVLTFNLIEIDDTQFPHKSKTNISKYFTNVWKNKLANDDLPRLQVYKIVNSNFETPNHLELPYIKRKIISKIRCSNHVLEIEKGRHTRTPREARLCKICEMGEIEDEGHFLLNCETYQTLKEFHSIHAENICDLLNMEDQSKLGGYLISAFQLREQLLNGRGRE